MVWGYRLVGWLAELGCVWPVSLWQLQDGVWVQVENGYGEGKDGLLRMNSLGETWMSQAQH
jgi:hypothetical protein